MAAEQIRVRWQANEIRNRGRDSAIESRDQKLIPDLLVVHVVTQARPPVVHDPWSDKLIPVYVCQSIALK